MSETIFERVRRTCAAVADVSGLGTGEVEGACEDLADLASGVERSHRDLAETLRTCVFQRWATIPMTDGRACKDSAEAYFNAESISILY